MSAAFKDASDLLRARGPEGITRALEQNQKPFLPETPLTTPTMAKPAGGLPPIISATELIRKEIPEPSQLIKGILHQGSKMVLGGGSKSFKTWSLLDLALSVATGQDWWGFKTTKAKVLYMNLELPDWSFKNRIEEIRGVRPELENVDSLKLWNLRGHAVSFEKMRPEIVKTIGKEYGLIVVDPIYKVYGDRDENAAGDMGTLLNEIESMAVQTGAAVVFGAHFSKGNQAGKESIDRISGSGVFARDPDTLLIMTRHECEDTFTIEATLRNFKPIKPFCVQRNHPLMERNNQLDPNKLKKPGKKPSYTIQHLLDALGEQSLTTAEWCTQTTTATGMSERSFHDKLKLLKDDPAAVTKGADGKWSQTKPTHEGTAELQ
jgi:hypothetical protein